MRQRLYIATRVDNRPVDLIPRGVWEVDSAHSTVGFEVRHLKISRVRGCFRNVVARASCEGPGLSSIEATIDVASIDTGDPKRDARLRAADFFDVDRYPIAHFRGAVAPSATADVLAVQGTMTLRGVTLPVELIAEPSREAADGEAGDRRVRARGVLSRREFGLDWDPAFAAGGLIIDDRVALRIDVTLRRVGASEATT